MYLLNSFHLPMYLVQCTYLFSVHLLTHLIYVPTSFFLYTYLPRSMYLNTLFNVHTSPLSTYLPTYSLYLPRSMYFPCVCWKSSLFVRSSHFFLPTPINLSIFLYHLCHYLFLCRFCHNFRFFICTFSRGTLHVFLPTTCLGPFLGFTLVPLLHIYFRVTSTKTKTTT